MTSKPPAAVDQASLQKAVPDCAVLIVAAGFERRARRVVEMLESHPPSRIVLVKYPEGLVKENDKNFDMILAGLAVASIQVVPVVLDPRRPDDYLQILREVLLKWRPDAVGEAWIDVSAMPMQGICATLAAVREILPALVVRVMYTEAFEYFPTKAEAALAEVTVPLLADRGTAPPSARKRAPRLAARASLAAPRREGPRPGVRGSARESGPTIPAKTFSEPAMSQEMAGNLIPKQFGGSSSEVSTCLIVFAGYEKHRSVGVVDELNPSKLVLVFGQPKRKELAWRLAWSQKLHDAIISTRPTASEVVSTLDPVDSLLVLNRYYSFLFENHNIALSPICSKMQCVACYLFWERYRDVQLVFPLPVSYLPLRFSKGYRSTFQFALPTTAEMSSLLPSPL